MTLTNHTQVGEASPNPSYPQDIKNTGDNGTINERIRKKDFFDESALTIDKWLFESGNEVNREGAIITDFISVSSSNDYILTNTYRYNATNNVTVCQYDKNRNWITGTTYSIPGYTNFNLPISDLNSNCEYIRISIYDFTHTSNNQFAEPISFPLVEGQKLMEGDYLADDGVHHKMGETVFDGSDDETWGLGSNIENTYSFYFADNTVAFNTDNRINVLSNYLKGNTPSQIIENAVIGICSRRGTSQGIYIRVPNTVATTASELKTWLSTHNLEVQYELATEVIEPYTEEQQAAWEEIKALRTYKGETHISSEDETPANIELEYVKEQKEIDLDNYVKNTDYATGSKAGVIKIDSTYGIITPSGTGLLQCYDYNYTNYSQKVARTFISKGTLEAVITGKELVNKTYVDDIVGDVESILEELDIGGGI